MRDIGKNIRQLRESCGLTQEDLATRLFVTRQTVSNYETGKTRPDVDMLIRLAEVLGTDANTVFYGPPVPESRKRAYRRMIWAALLIALMTAVSLWLHPLLAELRQRTYMDFEHMVYGIWDPILLIAVGWGAMQLISLLAKLKPLSGKWVGRLRVILIVLSLLCIALILPYSVDRLLDYQELMAVGTISRVGVSSFAPYAAVLNIVLYIDYYLRAIWVVVGAALWLCGFASAGKNAASDIS